MRSWSASSGRTGAVDGTSCRAWRRYHTPQIPVPTARGASYPRGAPIVAAHSASLFLPPVRANMTGKGELPGALNRSNVWGSVKVDTLPHVALGDGLTREARHGYYSAVTWMDEQLGRILGKLETHGFARDTLVVMHGMPACMQIERGTARLFASAPAHTSRPLTSHGLCPRVLSVCR